jgi:hypothetical protein
MSDNTPPERRGASFRLTEDIAGDTTVHKNVGQETLVATIDKIRVEMPPEVEPLFMLQQPSFLMWNGTPQHTPRG